MNKYTDGPWKATLEPRVNVKGPDKKSICALIMAAGANNRPYEEVCANARLIAAAPELLEALHIARMQIQADFNTRTQQPVERDANQIILNVISKAIAKAEGEV